MEVSQYIIEDSCANDKYTTGYNHLQYIYEAEAIIVECAIACELSSFNTRLLHITRLHLVCEHPGGIQADYKVQSHHNKLLVVVQVGCLRI